MEEVGCGLILEGWRPLRCQEDLVGLSGREEARTEPQKPDEGLVDAELRTEQKVQRQVGAHLPTASKVRQRLWACSAQP